MSVPNAATPPGDFEGLVEAVGSISHELHAKRLRAHALANREKYRHSLRDLPAPAAEKANSAIIISAGPSLRRQSSIQQILDAGYRGTTVAVDGCLIACLKAGLIPDYVLTLDPHETRIVRWFGDPNLLENSKNDDYFQRQDLDVEFRKNMLAENERNIQLINQQGAKIKALVASSSPANVVARIEEAGFPTYWWHPLVDDPRQAGSITAELYKIHRLSCMNTGGTVGTAAWVLAAEFLKIPQIAVVGMDLGYYHDLPYKMTQKYYELLERVGVEANLKPFFPEFEYPLTGERFYTDVTYYWYRRNFLDLVRLSAARTVNCTGGGVLFDAALPCMHLKDFLKVTTE